MTCQIDIYIPQLVVINKFSCKLEDVARTKAALSSYKLQVTSHKSHNKTITNDY